MRPTVFRVFALLAASSISIATPLPLLAAEEALSLQQLLAAAKEHNAELKSLRQEAATGEAARQRAGFHANPVFEIEGNTAAISGNSAENTVSLGISQEFSTGGRRQKRIVAADAEIARLKSGVADAERRLLLEVKSGYYDLMLAEKRLDLARQAYEIDRQLVEMTKERFAAGDIAEIDVNLARVEAARSLARKAAAERATVPIRLKLLSLIGAAPGAELKTAPATEANSADLNLQELTSLALASRPDLKALEAEVRRAEAEMAVARAERLPNIIAGVAFSRESTETTLRGVSERETDYLIGLKLSVPIPVFDRNQPAVAEAVAKKSSADIRLQALRHSIEREVETAHAALAAADEALKIYTAEILPQLGENLKIVQEAYRLGETGILAVIEEQKKFIEVTEGYLAARYERDAAEARLNAAVGTDLAALDGGKK